MKSLRFFAGAKPELYLALVVSLVVALLVPPAARPAQEPSDSGLDFPTEVDLVVVDAVVLDEQGLPVTGLTADDFALSEDGQPQVIASFHRVEAQEAAASAAPGRRSASVNTGSGPTTTGSFVIFYDDLNMDPRMGAYARGAVSEVLREHVREGDLLTLIVSSEGVSWSARMLAGRAEMLSLVERLGGRQMSRAAPSRQRHTEAMLESALIAQSDVPGRKSLVLVSGGFPSDLQRNSEKRMLRAARVANAAVYFVDARAMSGWEGVFTAVEQWGVDLSTEFVGQRPTSIGERRNYKSAGPEVLASQTGGFTIKNSNDLAGAVQRVFEENRNYYLLGYKPSNTKRDGRFRTIELQVKREGLRVRARTGYYAPTADEPPLKRP